MYDAASVTEREDDQLIEKLKSLPGAAFGAGAHSEEITLAELALELPIRGTYREFLRGVGWAQMEGHEIYGLGPEVPLHLELIRATVIEHNVGVLPFQVLPVMSSGGDWIYGLDTDANPEEPPVVIWDITVREIEPHADSFETFLSGYLQSG